MNKLRRGDIVARISYNKDILFEITRIIKLKDGNDIYILKGITKRIEADSPFNDLVKIDKRYADIKIKNLENRIYSYIENCLNTNGEKEPKNFEKRKVNQISVTGKILHLDGDKKYAEKSERYYKSLGLNAIVKNIPESKQPQYIISLLEHYKPDIVVVTGHDGMIKKGTDFNNIYNYRNSKYFINTVHKIRSWRNSKNVAIFAGACQSYYEALIAEGANFASSPARIMIDFIDPLIVAEKIATTDSKIFLNIYDIKNDLKEGERGISGVGTYGKKKNRTL